MLKIENTEVIGWEHAIRGMRNPKNSWDRSDSGYYNQCDECASLNDYMVGANDHKLMMSLAKGGPVHAKYRRMIVVYLDITAPLYWWKEFDTYKVGTVANSCSTMHKIQEKEFTFDDFSHEHLTPTSCVALEHIIECIEANRKLFLALDGEEAKLAWWQMIQLLPTSYNQKRTVMLNYEVLHNIYFSRKDHKLDEWHVLCDWIEQLPYSEIIIGKKEEK